MEITNSSTLDDRVCELQKHCEGLPQVAIPVRNYFAPGVYCREVTIPAGVVAVGARHKTEHLAILSKGRVQITTDDGVVEVEAPATMLSKPGAKRACYAITEAVFTTIHPTTETDLAKLCVMLTDTTEDELLGGPSNKQLLTSGSEEVA